MMNSLADELPFWHFDEELMVFNDGSLGAGIKLSGADISCWTSDEVNRFSSEVENLLISSGDGLKLQVFYKLSPNLKGLIDEHEKVSKEAPQIYKPISRARLKLMRSNLESKQYFLPEIYFFLRSSPYAYKKQKLFDDGSKFKKVSMSNYEEFKEKFLRNLKQVESSLHSAGLKPERLTQEEWFGLCFNYLNLERAEKIGEPELKGGEDLFSQSLNAQLALSDVAADKECVRIGNYQFRTITLKALPEGQTYASMIEAFTKLPFHMWISQCIHILNQGKEKSKLQLQRRIAHSMAAGSKNVSDLENENKLSNIEDLLTDLLEGSVKLLSQDMTVIIWGSSKEELEEKSDEILKAFRSLNQAEGLVETLPCKDAFLKALPGSCEGLRHKKMKSTNISHLMPLYSYWRGNKNPVCLLPNRDNGLFALDPFNPELPNWNGIVFGGSGSGKSFSITQLMLMFYGQKPRPRIIWIDNGASSQRLLEVLDGEFLDFKLDSGMCVNMFDLGENQIKPTPEKVKLILAVLELVLKDEDKAGIPKRQKALLEEAIYKVYIKSKGKTPTLSDLKKYLAAHEVTEMRNFSEILYSWTGDTAYGRLLDGQTTVKLSKDLVTIEVQSLNSHPELKDVILLLLTSYIQETSAADFHRPYLLIVDEAERLFQTELAKQFVITCYRTWRKFNSGIWCLSQNYKDFMQDKNLRDSLMPNTTSVIILRQRKINWNEFKETFDFNDAQVEVIKSLEIVKGKYSEFFYLQDEMQTVLRLVPEPLSYWICTSDGNDKAKIEKMARENPKLSKIEVLEKLAFPQTKKGEYLLEKNQ